MNPKQESEALMNAVLPLAEKMLRRHGEFYPYGGYMKADGTVVEIGASDPDTDHPKSKDMLYILRDALKHIARSQQCKAVAIVSDVAVTLPNSDRKSDAIQVSIEHSSHYSAEVFLPYQMTENNLVFGETFAQSGKLDIFTVSQS